MAADAGRKAQVVFDACRGPGLAAVHHGFEDNDRQAFGGCVNRGGEPGRTGAHNGDIVNRRRVDGARDADVTRCLGVARVAQDRAVAADDDGKVVLLHPKAGSDADGAFVDARVEERVRVAVAGEQVLQAHDVAIASAA